MNAAPNAHDKMQELRARYLDQIASVRDTVKYFLQLEALGELKDADRAKLNRIAHKVAGSGGTYGYKQLSGAARRVEQLTGPERPRGQALRHALTVLLEEMDALPSITPEPIRKAGMGVPPAPLKSAPGTQLTPQKGPQDPFGGIRQSAAATAPAPARAPEPKPAAIPEAPQPAAAARQPARQAPKPAAPAAANANRPKILIIEDDPIIVDILRTLMQGEFEIVTAEHGRNAEGLIAEEHPDLLILDDDLPGRTGVEILEAFHGNEDLRRTPAIMLTATTDPANVTRALDAGAINYFNKPFDSEGFVEYVRFVLAKAEDTVLIVDDDEAVREMLVAKFEASGLRTAQAESGLAALHVLREMTPALVVLDRMMPGLEGGPVLNELRRTPQSRKTPVIMLTASEHPGDALAWLKRGATDFVAKPFDPDEVVFRGLRAMGRDTAA